MSCITNVIFVAILIFYWICVPSLLYYSFTLDISLIHGTNTLLIKMFFIRQDMQLRFIFTAQKSQ